MLPYLSASAWGLLHLSVMWSTRTSRHGGLGDVRHRQGCSELAAALVNVVLVNLSVPHQFYIHSAQGVDAWKPRWPRPAENGMRLMMTISQEGAFDAEELLVAVAAVRSPPPRGAWWASPKMASVLRSCRRDPCLLNLLGALQAEPLLLPFYAQLLWHVGFMLQTNFMKAAVNPATVGFSLKYLSIADVLDQPHLLDRHISNYVQAGRLLAKNETFFTACSDKASVGGLGAGLSSSLFVLPRTDVGIVGLPQVASHAYRAVPFESDLQPLRKNDQHQTSPN